MQNSASSLYFISLPFPDGGTTRSAETQVTHVVGEKKLWANAKLFNGAKKSEINAYTLNWRTARWV